VSPRARRILRRLRPDAGARAWPLSRTSRLAGRRADVALVTKTDLAAAVEFDWDAARRNIAGVRPGMDIFGVSAKTGEAMTEYVRVLESRLEAARWKAPA
jgi:hypothetical protein